MIGRFNTLDPFSEMSRRNSLYNYALNNPIRFVDGMYVGEIGTYNSGDSGFEDALSYFGFGQGNQNSSRNKEDDPPKKNRIEILIWKKDAGLDVGHTAIKINGIVYGYYPSDENQNHQYDMSELILGSKGDMHVNNLEEFNNIYSGQTITSYGLNLTTKQLKNLESTLKKYVKDPGTYSLLWNTCTSVALASLLSSGVDLKTPGTTIANSGPTKVSNSLLYSPLGLANLLKSYVNKDVVSTIKTFNVPK